ncbi:ras-related protein Rab-4A-like isoform X1 [Littorina saxatilis]|uniref:ras-related protein Rab-4A-like isoform X1 n=1 Tax=Littorina saxatilis TaxID=31220 RepID=UPI0038B5101C
MHFIYPSNGVVDELTLVGIGSAGTGKTCLIKHFCESKYPMEGQTETEDWEFNTGYQPTVGVDYGFKIQTVNGTEMRVHMWDLSGSNEYMDVRNELYNGSDAIFVTYDVTNATTFEALDGWLREAHRFATGNPDIFIVGNKTDLSKKRTVPSSEGKKFALQNRCLFFETSAATGEGVDTMFDQILQEIAKKRKSTSANSNKRSR